MFYTRDQLRAAHERSGHTGVRALVRFLELGNPKELVTEEDVKLLKEIIEACLVCQRFGRGPRRIRFSPVMEYIFNRCVALDLFYLRGLPALSMVDIPSTYGNAAHLRSESAVDCWRTFYQRWVLTYVGPPMYIVVDRGPQLVSNYFVRKCNEHGIRLIAKGTEAHWQWGAGERWHRKVKDVHDRAWISASKEGYTPDDLLALSVYCVNSAPTDAGTSPVLTLYGQLPRLLAPQALGEFSEPVTNAERHATITVARSVAEAAAGRERFLEMTRRAPPSDPTSVVSGDLVFVWRERGEFAGPRPGKSGPFIFLHRIGSVSWVLVDGKPWSVASTHITPATTEDAIPDEKAMDLIRELASKPRPRLDDKGPAQTELDRLGTMCCQVFLAPDAPVASMPPPRRARQHVFAFRDFKTRCRGVAAAASDIESRLNQALHRTNCDAEVLVTRIVTAKDDEYDREAAEHAMAEELEGLLAAGALEFVHESDVPPNSNVIGTRMILSLKHHGTSDQAWKARLVTQGCLDRESDNVLSESATVATYSIRTVIAIARTMRWPLRSKDARRAYLQGDDLSRAMFARLPRELRRRFADFLFKIVKPVYGLKEAGAYWFAKYFYAWLTMVLMLATSLDVCLLYRRPGKHLEGVVAVQVDDTLMAGCEAFNQAEEKMHKLFDMGDTQELQRGQALKFSGCEIRDGGDSTTVSQTDYVGKLAGKKLPQGVVPTMSAVKSSTGAIGWAATQTRPTVAYQVSQLNQVTPATLTTAVPLKVNDVIQTLLETREHGLVFPEMDLETMYIAAYGDASLAGNDDLTSQMGGIICLLDDKGHCAPLHWYSKKCPRVVSSILAGETIACVTTFDFAFAIRHTLEELLGRPLKMFLFTDSYSLFTTVTKYQCIREKRLMVDLTILRQAYRSGDATNFGFVTSDCMLADPLTKDTACPLLDEMLATGTLEHPVAEYVADITRAEPTTVDVSILFATFAEHKEED